MRLGLVQIPVALDETNGDEIVWMCASANMAIYAIEITMLEVSGSFVTLQQGALNSSMEMISSPNVWFMKFRIHPVS